MSEIRMVDVRRSEKKKKEDNNVDVLMGKIWKRKRIDERK
jgi:hypothetical protein